MRKEFIQEIEIPEGRINITEIIPVIPYTGEINISV